MILLQQITSQNWGEKENPCSKEMFHEVPQKQNELLIV
jgi:hypothetical protein